MRPPRVAILVLSFAASVFLVCRSISSIGHPTPAVAPSTAPKSSFRAFFSFTSPFSLFPPSAAISLIDDNSTFFPARPAAFGPSLPAKGLSGQLWIGSGFSDDSLQEGDGEGELGCSDSPGWEDGWLKLAVAASETWPGNTEPAPVAVDEKGLKTNHPPKDPVADRDTEDKRQLESQTKSVDDGTDDYPHRAFQTTRSSYKAGSAASGSAHADIQSIQETAEITGKIVLLSRGGCSFLDKVKWAQRRGAVALIVGDNQKGGPLIQMFARGNVDNVTIPSVFTSRTTAHLLSSLTQPGSFMEGILNGNGGPMLTAQHTAKVSESTAEKTAFSAKRPSTASAVMASGREGPTPKMRPTVRRRSWLSRLFRWGDNQGISFNRSRPPRSGRLDWVLVDDGDSENDRLTNDGPIKTAGGASKDSNDAASDRFRIGVQDWRDSDVVRPTAGDSEASASHGSADDSTLSSDSGASARHAGKPGNSPRPSSGSRRRRLPKIFSGNEDAENGKGYPLSDIQGSSAAIPSPDPPPTGRDSAREGLWVTITPTGSASPFFDTLLVLVISPLITLTVVYALLIIRVKIRMRRWRAPKSVVDRLPVRTYHTVAPSPTRSPRTPSPASSSPTTPLLQDSSRSRPQSRTTTGVIEPGDLPKADDAAQTAGPPSHEKSSGGGSSQWRKYMGRQVECVVCLEEYVDGVSRVMSLPCGHEFHAECITPWLTTRRRTCPICKSDVVRSLARGSPSSGPQYEQFREDGYDSGGEASDRYQDRLPSPNPLEEDLERRPTWTQRPRQEWHANRHDVWFSALTGRLGGSSSFSTRREGSGEDRGQ